MLELELDAGGSTGDHGLDDDHGTGGGRCGEAAPAVTRPPGVPSAPTPAAAAGETQIGLTADDVEQLRTIYLQKGIASDVTDCVVNDTVQALDGQPVTQELLASTLADAGARCGGGGGGGNLVQSIIDNYPSGGPVSSTTTYP
ncbi:MAG: hypothetical protein R2726_14250 [Acidimicrobiales bacterium]